MANWTRLTGLLGVSAVAAGAYGAHGLKGNEAFKDVYKTANSYHFTHTLALAVATTQLVGRKRNIVCGLFTSGILVFSGACYTVALTQERQPFSKLAPIGGLLLMGGWLAFGIL
ncbi:hypothetical protein B484DRAFT_405459 [Ochromonadaceae sp. CCMP2298]|nr:hypothetical protein B484DRAFT_405459 [Ochromonadaceae sp. CCMP2298]|mmetsp:Transcript_4014/g.9033  ORF Transcript_4014/g.9033 Transcript_4014/m.9033 type:complete len:114 (+) Transcript_4014:161-502(+)|eukprot:CAMPEP_0173193356 /NCGR_PEP_ID=MMETSP1141-20130122/13913_1 /TAXON_ID=483371 /ORGANISM="non described non described, Strain CCMP2298" /LENGTH=113 /DNA_ID=CAMNT_0014117683 /DNA_START=78 /DNA_END=419 /DNA_ORIENTATION=+